MFNAGAESAVLNHPFVCISSDLSSGSNSPFGTDSYVLSLGFIVTAVLVIPFSMSNLDDNIALQVSSSINNRAIIDMCLYMRERRGRWISIEQHVCVRVSINFLCAFTVYLLVHSSLCTLTSYVHLRSSLFLFTRTFYLLLVHAVFFLPPSCERLLSASSQVGGMAVFGVCMVVLLAQFIGLSLPSPRDPWWPAQPDATSTAPSLTVAYIAAVETILANYFFVMTVPSWLAEKRPGVSVSRTIIGAVAISTLLYVLLGLCSVTSPIVWSGTDLISTLVYSSQPVWLISRIAAFVFPLTTLLTSIPVFAVVVRYNLVNARLVSVFVQVFMCAV